MGEHMSKEIDKEFWNLVDERLHQRFLKEYGEWPAPGSADTELGVLMEPEVSHGKAEVYTRVQA
jgi:hypothetical protein